MKDLVLPFRILISPFKTFSQLVQKTSLKGLISLSALIIVVVAAAQYASATKIDLQIDGQRTSFLATSAFNDWFASSLVWTAFWILLYWLAFTSFLMLISKTFGGKDISWRILFVNFAYLLSVFIVLYAVRAAVYFALPTLYFQDISSWPPVDTEVANAASKLMTDSWGPLFAYQFGIFFTLIAFAWLIVLGAIAVKALREVTWGKAVAVSVIGFSIVLFLFGLP